MKTGEDLYCKVHQSPRLPRVVLAPNSKYGRQDLSTPEARKSTDHQSEQSVKCRETCRLLLEDTSRKHPGESQRCKCRETCRGNVDYKIPGIPHSTVQKEDSNRKDTVKRLIQQFENHHNRDSLIQNLNKTEEFNPFSEKSKELITSMGNTEYFQLCETSSEIQCPDLRSWHRITCGKWCSRRKGIDSWTRLDTTCCQSLATLWKKILPMVSYPWRARHESSMRQCMNYKAHEMLENARKHKNGYKNILDRWNKDDKYRKSLSDIG